MKYVRDSLINDRPAPMQGQLPSPNGGYTPPFAPQTPQDPFGGDYNVLAQQGNVNQDMMKSLTGWGKTDVYDALIWMALFVLVAVAISGLVLQNKDVQATLVKAAVA